MAYTKVLEPALIQPVYNNLNYRFIDDDITKLKFRYIFKLYVDGVYKDTTKLQPRPDGYVNYDASKILKQYISRTFRPGLAGYTQSNSTECVRYNVNYGVEFDVAGTLTEYMKDSGSSLYAWNGVAQWNDAMSITSSYVADFMASTASPADYLNWPYLGTNLTNANLLYKDDERTLSFFRYNLSGEAVSGIKITTFENGAVSKTYYYEFPATEGTAGGKYINHFPIGISQLNAITWTGGSLPAGHSNYILLTEDEGMMIQLYSGVYASQSFVSKPLYFRFTEPCSNCRTKHYTIAYQSPNGGYGYINFDLKAFETITNEKITYDKVKPYNYSTTDRITNVYGNLSGGSWELNTDWIYYQGQMNQIVDMIQSPELWLIDEVGTIKPVYLEKTNFTIGNHKQDGMNIYNFKFNEAYPKNTIY
jgi:hypothetical protein